MFKLPEPLRAASPHRAPHTANFRRPSSRCGKIRAMRLAVDLHPQVPIPGFGLERPQPNPACGQGGQAVVVPDNTLAIEQGLDGPALKPDH